MSLREELKAVADELEATLPDLQQKQARFLDLMIKRLELKAQMRQLLNPKEAE